MSTLKSVFICTVAILFLFTLPAKSQQSFDSIISTVISNNLSLKAADQMYAAQELTFKTGLRPQNPGLEMEYLPGMAGNAGVKQKYGVSQSFDFPTSYSSKKTLSKLQISQLSNEKGLSNLQVKTRVAELYSQIVYLNILLKKLDARINEAAELYDKYLILKENGGSSDLETGKIKMQLSLLEVRKIGITSDLENCNTSLKALNGGIPLAIDQTSYSALIIPSKEEFISRILESSPSVKSAANEVNIAEQEEKVKRGLTAPGFEIGYVVELEPADAFSGVAVGLTLPLWQHKNVVQAAKANTAYSKMKAEEVRSEFETIWSGRYDYLSSLGEGVENMKAALEAENGQALLGKSLEIGNISTLDYIREKQYYYSLEDEFLELQYKYNAQLVELYVLYKGNE